MDTNRNNKFFVLFLSFFTNNYIFSSLCEAPGEKPEYCLLSARNWLAITSLLLRSFIVPLRCFYKQLYIFFFVRSTGRENRILFIIRKELACHISLHSVAFRSSFTNNDMFSSLCEAPGEKTECCLLFARNWLALFLSFSFLVVPFRSLSFLFYKQLYIFFICTNYVKTQKN